MEFRHDIDTNQIPPHLQQAAFRIVQESLANACRHSKSTRILVDLTQDDHVLRIQIQDSGVGFDPDSAPCGHFGLEEEQPSPFTAEPADNASCGHFGLEGIRRRVRLLRGTATIRSTPGKGTCVTVELPLMP